MGAPLTSGGRSANDRPVAATGMCLALAGGFLDAYTYISRGGVFANAQTGNVGLLAIAISRGHAAYAVRCILPIGGFVIGVAGAESLKPPAIARRLRHPARTAIAFEAVVLAVVGLLPAAVPDRTLTLIISAMLGFQVQSIRTLGAWSYDTTMTTGNLRSAMQAAVHAVAGRDSEALSKALNPASVVVSFAVGATGALLTIHLHDRSIWVAGGILGCSLGLFVFDA